MKKPLLLALITSVALGAVYFLSKEKTVKVGIVELILPEFDRELVTRVVYAGKENFTLIKGTEKYLLSSQNLAGQKSVVVSEEAVRELFDAISKVNSGIFVTEQLRKHGDFKVTEKEGQRVTVMSKDKAVWDLIIGDYATEGGRYVRVPNTDGVFLSKARFWDITRNNMSDFREHQIVKVDENTLQRIRLNKIGKTQVTLIKNGQNLWQFDRALMGDVKMSDYSEEKISEYVNLVRDLRATDFVDEEKNTVSVNSLLKKQGYQLILTPKESAEIVVNIARDDAEKKSFVKREGEDTIYVISDYAASKIVASLGDFKKENGV